MNCSGELLRFTAALIAFCLPSAATAQPSCEANAALLVTGLRGGSGSTVGPGGALYVTEAAAGTVLRVDPKTGETTTFATGLPRRVVGTGGAMDIAFLGGTAYVLVTLVGPDVGGSNVVGIYRVDKPGSISVIADLGQFALANPPDTAFAVPTGVQYALEIYRGHRWAPQPRAAGHARRRNQ